MNVAFRYINILQFYINYFGAIYIPYSYISSILYKVRSDRRRGWFLVLTTFCRLLCNETPLIKKPFVIWDIWNYLSLWGIRGWLASINKLRSSFSSSRLCTVPFTLLWVGTRRYRAVQSCRFLRFYPVRKAKSQLGRPRLSLTSATPR